ncbi:MAG TPA: guanylate kinase [Verrucomicrobiae bacterium]|jgi:guanylate kinase|nr:guanylate kinase [Verrucomicrobiae bacterium]
MNETRAPLLIVLSAPSGGGKTTLCQQLLAAHPEMTRAVTCTTRPPRTGERDGIDYFFLTPEAFAERVNAGDFLEHAIVYGQFYGTPKAEALDKLRQGRDVLLAIDVQGAATVCARAANDAELRQAMVTVFLTPGSLEILAQRLQRRGANLPEDLRQRLEVARVEIEQWKNFQYLIISSSVQEDLRRMEAIIEAERMRQVRAIAPLT